MPLLDALKSLLPAWPARPADAVKAASATVAYTFGTTSVFVPSLDGYGADGGVDYSLLAGDLRSNTVVVVCNGWYATNFPTARPQVGRIEADTGEFVALGSDLGPRKRKAALDHPAVRWLSGRPNPFYSWRQVWACTLEDWNVDGNAFWLKAGGDPYEIYWLPRCRVNVVPPERDADSNNTPVVRYEYTNPRGKVERYRPEEIVHFRDGIDPNNPHLGLSRLRRLARSVAAINAGEVYASARARNGHNGVLITPKDGGSMGAWGGVPEEAQLRQITGRVNQGLAGPEAGRAQWANMPVDLHRFGDSAGDAGIELLMNRPETNIAAALGLNTMVLGLPSSAGTRSYANYAEADRQAWYNGVIPRQDAFAEVVTDSILRPEFGDDLVMAWDRSVVPSLNEDAESRVKRAIDLRQPDATGKPLISLNEARDLCDYPPIEGGDLTPIEELEALSGEAEEEEEDEEIGGGPGAPLVLARSDTLPLPTDPDPDLSPDPDLVPIPSRNGNGRLRAAKTARGPSPEDAE